VISMRYFLTIRDFRRLTRSLPLPVLTVSKFDVRLLSKATPLSPLTNSRIKPYNARVLSLTKSSEKDY